VLSSPRLIEEVKLWNDYEECASIALLLSNPRLPVHHGLETSTIALANTRAIIPWALVRTRHYEEKNLSPLRDDMFKVPTNHKQWKRISRFLFLSMVKVSLHNRPTLPSFLSVTQILSALCGSLSVVLLISATRPGSSFCSFPFFVSRAPLCTSILFPSVVLLYVVSALLFGCPGASSPFTLGWWVFFFGAEPAGRTWILKVSGSSEVLVGLCWMLS